MSTVEPDDVTLWLAWKRVNELIRGRILAEVTTHASLTEPELTVLVHLDQAGGSLRQNVLASAAGWDRTRLSHLLTRMETRGQLRRERLRNGVEVTLLDPGREALATTQAPLADAVHRHFTSRLDAENRAALVALTDALSD
jgi:DNA-binding MarR family transcriptional regulator